MKGLGAPHRSRSGLPDEWEIPNGLNPYDSTGDNGASGDPDHDGFTNLQEYLAGTSPTNALDYLKFDEVSMNTACCILKFTLRAGRTYNIERLDALDRTYTWTTLLSDLTGASTITVFDPHSPVSRFYRLNATRTE